MMQGGVPAGRPARARVDFIEQKKNIVPPRLDGTTPMSASSPANAEEDNGLRPPSIRRSWHAAATCAPPSAP
jgi:hypothetical protein